MFGKNRELDQTATSLSDFVHATLLDIVSGIELAQKDATTTGFVVSPDFRGDTAKLHISAGRLVEFVEFDLSVKSTVSSSNDAGFKIAVVGTQGNIAGKNSRQAEHLSKVRFRVPLAFPKNKF